MLNEKELEQKTVMTNDGERVVAEPMYATMEQKWLKVYVDQEKNQYYIDIFAASELGLCSYQEASLEYDRGGRFFLLTPEQLQMLRDRFQDRIVYLYFANGKALDSYSLLKEDKINFYGLGDEQKYESEPVNNFDDTPKYEPPMNDISGYQVDNFDGPKTM